MNFQNDTNFAGANTLRPIYTSEVSGDVEGDGDREGSGEGRRTECFLVPCLSTPACVSVSLGERFCLFVILFTIFSQTLYLQSHVSFVCEKKIFRVLESSLLRLY